MLFSLAFAAVLLSGCTQQPAPQDYVILSTQDYNRSLCGGTGFNYQENGFNSGIKILAKDSQTGSNPTSNSYIITQSSEGSIFPFSFSCEEQLSDPQSVISVYSNGHSPKIFEFNLPENQLVAIEVPLKKSCTGGFLKAQGTSGSAPFTLYYHSGWCSPGGGDCGRFACFSESSASPSAAYAAIKDKLCNSIEYFNLTGYYNPQDNTYSYVKTNDLTNQTRTECLRGGFEKTGANSRTISIVQDSSMAGAFARKGETDCLAL